jgi:hypothetical protein
MRSVIKKAFGIIIYEVDNKRRDNSPLLLIVGWKVGKLLKTYALCSKDLR